MRKKMFVFVGVMLLLVVGMMVNVSLGEEDSVYPRESGSYLTSSGVDLAKQTDQFIRGDAKGNGDVVLSDAIYIFNWLFGGPALNCMDAGDAKDNGDVVLSDAIYIFNWLFGGPAPPAPFPNCGIDPTPDVLGCLCHPFCMGCTPKGKN